VFILCVLFPGLKVLWTAHRLRTSTNTFKALQGYARRARVAPHIADIRRAHAEQEIVFANGSIIMFGARESGFGRGFDEVDVEVFDEAQILTEKALEDMVAATNQSRHPHGALLFYMGTPPRPVDPGEAFTQRRNEALSVKEPGAAFDGAAIGEDTVYIECSADADASPDDREQWAKANPSYPHRTPLRSMLRLRKNLPSDESWRREGLGIWDSGEDVQPINLVLWAAAAEGDEHLDPELLSDVRLALDAPPDRRTATFSVAGVRPDGLRHVQIRRHVPAVERDDDRPLRARVIGLARALTVGHSTALIMPPNSYASAWKADLEAAGVELDVLTATEYAQACGDIQSAVNDGTIRHRNQSAMNTAVEGLVVRASAGIDVWDRRKAALDIAPFVAATCALSRVPAGEPMFAGGFTALSDYNDDDDE
jgi:phage terminase large subunit-like protein